MLMAEQSKDFTERINEMVFHYLYYLLPGKDFQSDINLSTEWCLEQGLE